MLIKNLSIIVAISENFGIGKNNDMLFHLSEDLKRFKAITSGKTIIMGRKTLFSLPKWPLPNRRHIIITSDKSANFEGCEVANTIQEAVHLTQTEEEVFIIGGGTIYEQFYPLAHRIYLTRVDKSFEADVYFPTINFEDWKIELTENHFSEKNNFEYSYLNLVRK